MTIRLYVEEDAMDKDLVQAIRARGVDVITALDAGMIERADEEEFPLFPGYCFIRCTVQDHRQVKMAAGVVEVLGVAGRPVPVPVEEVEAVRRLVTSVLPVDPHPTLVPGMAVEVIRGPLAGLRGVLIRKGPRARLLVGITLLSQGASVDIDAADVMAV